MLHLLPGFLLVLLLSEIRSVQMYIVLSDEVIFDITRSHVPVLLIVACNIVFVPNTTFPKSRLAGLIANPASTPVPCNEYTVGDPAALCVNVKSAVVSPSAVGVYVTSNTWFPPGSIVIGNHLVQM